MQCKYCLCWYNNNHALRLHKCDIKWQDYYDSDDNSDNNWDIPEEYYIGYYDDYTDLN